MRHKTAKFYSSFSKTFSGNRRFCKKVNKENGSDHLSEAGKKALSTEHVLHSQQVFSKCLLWPEKREMALALGWKGCIYKVGHIDSASFAFYLTSIIIKPSALLPSFSLAVLLGSVFLSPLPSFSFIVYPDATHSSLYFSFYLTGFPLERGVHKSWSLCRKI